MSDDGIADSVRKFIVECLDSVEQLEVLLFLRSEPDKAWLPVEVSRRLYIDRASAGRRMEGLHKSGLLARDTSDKLPRFRYAPATPEQTATVTDLAAAYRVRRVAVINLIIESRIAEKRQEEYRSFSDAFRFRDQLKDKDED